MVLWQQTSPDKFLSVLLLQCCLSTCGGHQFVMEAYVSGRNFNTFIHSAFSKYVCSTPAEARATIGQFSMSGNDYIMSGWRSNPSSAELSDMNSYNSYNMSGWRDMTESPEPSGPGNSQRPILIDDVLRVWLNRPRPWRGAPWRPIRHIHGASYPIGQQPGAYMIHGYVSVHFLWLLVNNFLNLGSLCNFRTSCRLAYRGWVISEPELVMRWLRHCLRGYVHTFNNREWVRSMERHNSYVLPQERALFPLPPYPYNSFGIVPERAVGVSTSRPVMPVLNEPSTDSDSVWTREVFGSDSVRSVRGEVLHTATWNQMAESLGC